MDLLINIDVPDLRAGIAFYTAAFGLTVTRHLGGAAVELEGLPSRLYLLEKPAGSVGAGTDLRRYDRHWTPVHLDVVVDDIASALARVVSAGAIIEHDVRSEPWGKVAVLADPFGHGFCLIEFTEAGYDALA